jgi:hypothetical protein
MTILAILDACDTDARDAIMLRPLGEAEGCTFVTLHEDRFGRRSASNRGAFVRAAAATAARQAN